MQDSEVRFSSAFQSIPVRSSASSFARWKSNLNAAIFVLLSATTTTMAIDLEALWDFSRPELSQQRFQAALETATGDEALILQTQIARTHGLRKDFSKAREILNSVEQDLPAGWWPGHFGRSVERTKPSISSCDSSANATWPFT